VHPAPVEAGRVVLSVCFTSGLPVYLQGVVTAGNRLGGGLTFYASVFVPSC
jgi:hypothetical protein